MAMGARTTASIMSTHRCMGKLENTLLSGLRLGVAFAPGTTHFRDSDTRIITS